MSPTNRHRPALLSLCLALAAPLAAQQPPGIPAADPGPGAGQARRELQPPSGPSSSGATVRPIRPDNDLPGTQAQSPEPGTTLADPRLPRPGVGTLNIDALAVGGVDIALDPVNVVANFQATPRGDQDVALADLRTRVDATTRALTELRSRARAQGLEVDATLQGRLTAEMEEKEEALKRTLSTAPMAGTDEEWRRIQSEVSVQYQDYANAVRRVQLSLQADSTATPPQP